MNRRTIVIFAAILQFASATAEESPEWLLEAIKTDDPDSLAYFVFAEHECPFGDPELNQITEGVLIRSRIKPSTAFLLADSYLNVSVSCMNISVGGKRKGYWYFADVRFGRYVPHPPVLFDHSFGVMGIASDAQDALDHIKRAVEAAATAYIRGNLDLDPE